MIRPDLASLMDKLTDRDYAILGDVERFRLLSTKQIQRLHFDACHPTPAASARACNRLLHRLREAHVLKSLDRRIGGVRAGSAGFIWYIGPAGERLLANQNRRKSQNRRNYREPSRHFVEHTLAVSELAVTTIEAERQGVFEILTIQSEPASWQQALLAFGTTLTLKPDLRLVTASADYEHHWFIEVDMATEHMPVIMRQCAVYDAFRTTGRYQAIYGLFPAVLWVVPGIARAQAIRATLATTGGIDPALFRVCTPEEYLSAVADGDDHEFRQPVPDRT
ncbi:replication-relaxation family protein [Ferrimicrobium sp.]|uniref:replication-relaxation family protein n=1 Tax=Ferrimicrobium sp. TaxID=2926050 RepID=UPI00262127FC|nr:replication-relaxation family protein [Ferrimicrobium sp.]